MNNWDLKYLDLCRKVASWSKDPSTKCGAWIVDDEYLPLSFGFNGFPRGVNDDPALYANRDEKILRVEHSERNAISNCHFRPKGGIMYLYSTTGWSVCNDCAKGIIQSGIKKVIMPSHLEVPQRAKSYTDVAYDMMLQRGIEIVEYPLSLNIPDYSIWGPVAYEDRSCKCSGEDNKS
jgi:dCMP deaminase